MAKALTGFFPFKAFLKQLESAGFLIGPHTYCEVYEAVCCLGAFYEENPEGMLGVLRAIIVKEEAEIVVFDQLFVEYYSTYILVEVEELDEEDDTSHSPEESSDTGEESNELPEQEDTEEFHEDEDWEFSKWRKEVDEGEEEEVVKEVGYEQVYFGASAQVKSLESGGYKRPYHVPWKRYVRGEAWKEGRRDWEQLEALADTLRYWIEGERREMDVRHTIRATLNKGYPSVRYRYKGKRAEFLVLIETKDSEDHQALLLEYWLKQLVKRDAYMHLFVYRGDPRYVHRVDTSERFSLEQLQRSYTDCQLLVVGEGKNLLNPWADKVVDWLDEELRFWPDRVFLSTKAVVDWGVEEWILAQCFRLLPASLKGQYALVDFLYKEDEIDFWELEKYFSEDEAELDGVTLLDVDLLKEGFGQSPIWDWLCVLALYSDIRWGLTFAIGQELERLSGKPLLTYKNFYSLSRFPWLHGKRWDSDVRFGLWQDLVERNPVLASQMGRFILGMVDEMRGELEGTFALRRLNVQRVFLSEMLNQTISEELKEKHLYAHGLEERNTGFVLVEGGTFEMGSDAQLLGVCVRELPRHEVVVDGFYMGKSVVTFQQYKIFCSDVGIEVPNDEGWGREERPVIHVSWFDAVRYCNWLSKKFGYSPCYTIKEEEDSKEELIVSCDFKKGGYRLPTEAEWEYAARGGGKDTVYGNGENDARPLEIHFDVKALPMGEGVSEIRSYERTIPVGTFKPNGLGLFDMSGNVWEWCWDWFDAYQKGRLENPTGAKGGIYRVVRGGSWRDSGLTVRSGFRKFEEPNAKNCYTGFRIVRRRVE